MTIDKEKAIEFLATKEDGTLKHRESQTLEFKESFNFAGLAEYLKDFAAFANNKGGWLIFGIIDRPKRTLKGLTGGSKEQVEKLDPEKIAGFLLEDFAGNIDWSFDTFTYKNLTFAAFHIEEALIKPIICKKDEGNILKNGDIYFRYGGRTQKVLYPELENIISHRLERQNSQWIDLVTKIGKSGPHNAAILDMERGTLTKDSQVLVVDAELVKNVKWIKQGHFDEEKGAPALKLIGDVKPIDNIEVVKIEKQNRLKEYPLSAKELADAIKKKTNISQQNVWRIINENDLKANSDYSIYNFRNKSQEENYEKTGKVSSGVPSIYKESAIDYIIQLYNNEDHEIR